MQLADDVGVGPYCILDGTMGPIRVGAGTRLMANVHITGPMELGKRNTVYPFVCLGFAPQDLKWDPARAGAGVRIGDGNTFREHVTIHRATSDDSPTVIGDNNYFMACSHVGHDCVIASNCIFANSTLLGGFVRIDERVITGGNATVHQFCRVGRGAMLSGSAGMSQDLPPFFMLTALNLAGSINVVGLRRMEVFPRKIDTVRWVYKTLYRRGLSTQSALAALQERYEREKLPIIEEYIEFIGTSRRGICPGVARPARGGARASRDGRLEAGAGSGVGAAGVSSRVTDQD